MPPLEDELRAVLQGRAATLAPPVDPVPGVERRVRALRRRRTGAALVGTALAVLAVAAAVPLLSPDRSAAPDPSDQATSAPSTPPSPSASASDPLALAPDAPWAYRGDVALRAQQASLSQSWTARHPGTTSVVPLFGRVWEPSGRPEVVLLARGTGGDSWGVVTSSEAGWRVLFEQELPSTARALVAALPGDEADRVLVVAAPEADPLVYEPRAAAGRQVPLAALAPGVATGPLEQGDVPDDGIASMARGEVAFRAAVPDVARDEQVQDAAPANVVDWPVRGEVDSGLVLSARAAYAAGRPGTDAADAQEKVLFAHVDGDLQYLLGQFWVAGDEQADTFAVVVHGRDDVEPQLYRALSADGTTDLVAMHLPPPDGSTGGGLVVVQRPGLGTLSYSPDGVQAFAAAQPGSTDGVFVVARSDAAERAGTDRLQVDSPARGLRTYAVAQLLCGTTSCG
ncbi:MAG: hypothetical protein JWO60_2168 [Frankiales bacterium]|nr:hypothetical protein [Frankiales bacterium]